MIYIVTGMECCGMDQVAHALREGGMNLVIDEELLKWAGGNYGQSKLPQCPAGRHSHNPQDNCLYCLPSNEFRGMPFNSYLPEFRVIYIWNHPQKVVESHNSAILEDAMKNQEFIDILERQRSNFEAFLAVADFTVDAKAHISEVTATPRTFFESLPTEWDFDVDSAVRAIERLKVR